MVFDLFGPREYKRQALCWINSKGIVRIGILEYASVAKISWGLAIRSALQKERQPGGKNPNGKKRKNKLPTMLELNTTKNPRRSKI